MAGPVTVTLRVVGNHVRVNVGTGKVNPYRFVAMIWQVYHLVIACSLWVATSSYWVITNEPEVVCGHVRDVVRAMAVMPQSVRWAGVWAWMLCSGVCYCAAFVLRPLWWIMATMRRGDVQLTQLLAEDDEADIAVDIKGGLNVRHGVALRLAREVKLRFGGTPSNTEANRLVAARYIQDAMTEHGITRKIDCAKMMYKVRAIVFTPLDEEIDEARMVAGMKSRGLRAKLAALRSGVFAYAQ